MPHGRAAAGSLVRNGTQGESEANCPMSPTPKLMACGTLRRIAHQASVSVRERAQEGSDGMPGGRTRLSKAEKDKAMNILGRSYLKSWLNAHGQHLRPPKLHSSVMKVIEAWFELVDEDGSGGLDSNELAAALKTAGLPCDEQSILEMIRLMDMNHDNQISWVEFERFLTHEFAAGKALLSGEYVLPSGTALPFGAMVSKLKRNKIMADVLKGGERRDRWSNLACDETKLSSELNMLATAQAEQEAYRKHAMLRGFTETPTSRSHSRAGLASDGEESSQQPASQQPAGQPPTPTPFGEDGPFITGVPGAPAASMPTGLMTSSHDGLTPLDQDWSEVPLPSLRQPAAPGVRDYRAMIGAATSHAHRRLNNLSMTYSQSQQWPSAHVANPELLPHCDSNARVAETETAICSPVHRLPAESSAGLPSKPFNRLIQPSSTDALQPPPAPAEGQLAASSGLAASIYQHSISRSLNLLPPATSMLARMQQPKLPQPSSIPDPNHNTTSYSYLTTNNQPTNPNGPQPQPQSVVLASTSRSPSSTSLHALGAPQPPALTSPRPDAVRAANFIRDSNLVELFAAVAASDDTDSNSFALPTEATSPQSQSGPNSSTNLSTNLPVVPAARLPEPSAPPPWQLPTRMSGSFSSIAPPSIHNADNLAGQLPTRLPGSFSSSVMPTSCSAENLTVQLLQQMGSGHGARVFASMNVRDAVAAAGRQAAARAASTCGLHGLEGGGGGKVPSAPSSQPPGSQPQPGVWERLAVAPQAQGASVEQVIQDRVQQRQDPVPNSPLRPYAQAPTSDGQNGKHAYRPFPLSVSASPLLPPLVAPLSQPLPMLISGMSPSTNTGTELPTVPQPSGHSLDGRARLGAISPSPSRHLAKGGNWSTAHREERAQPRLVMTNVRPRVAQP